MTSLYNVTKSGYKNKEKQSKNLNGYIRDNELSSGNHQAYYNPKNKKLLFNVTGTHNLSDVITDGYLAFGGLKNTSRYKEADKMLKKAKEKYKPTSTSVTGHSLGSAIGSSIASKNDKVTTLDGGYTFGQKTRSNNNAYRTAGDAVSLLGANATHMTTLKNDNKDKFTKIGLNYGLGAAIGGKLIDTYNAHNVDNIKNEKIFV
jgi:hypothetical protein